MSCEERREAERRVHTPEFKAETVSGANGGAKGDGGAELAWPRAWCALVRKADVDAGRGPVGALTTAEKEELWKLRKENKVLRMEREILKRAATFFAKENE